AGRAPGDDTAADTAVVERDRGRRGRHVVARPGRAVQVAAQLVEREPPAELGLEAAVHVELRVRALDEERGQPGQDDRQDHRDREQLDERESPLAAQSRHAALALTSASALRATDALFEPIPHADSARASTWTSSRSASSPRHQPNLAPSTIHSFWNSQCLTLAFVGFGCAASQRPSCLARSGSGISSSGSAGAPATTKAGGRFCACDAGLAAGLAATVAVFAGLATAGLGFAAGATAA